MPDYADIEEDYFKEVYKKKLVLDTNMSFNLDFDGFESSFNIPEKIEVDQVDHVDTHQPILINTTVAKGLSTDVGKSLFE